MWKESWRMTNEVLCSEFFHLMIFNFQFSNRKINVGAHTKYSYIRSETYEIKTWNWNGFSITLGFSRWFVIIFSVDSWSLQGHCRCVTRVVNETRMSSKRPGVSQCAVHHSAGILTLPSGAALTNNERKASLQMRQKHFNRVRSHSQLSALVPSELKRLSNALSQLFCSFFDFVIDLQCT